MGLLRSWETVKNNQKEHPPVGEEVSVVVPVWNEVLRLGKCVEKLQRELRSFIVNFEIIISEDGSTDGTKQIAYELSNKIPCIEYLHSDVRLGKGKAIQKGIQTAEGEIVVYTDVDLSTDLYHMRELVRAIRNGADIAIGSRLLKGSSVHRSLHRRIITRIYNWGVRAIFGSPVHDHQCGFKAFRKATVSHLLDKIEDNHWFWDTELIIRAIRQGYRIDEVPIRWSAGKQTKVRLSVDAGYMVNNIFRLWRQLRKERIT